MAARLIFIWNGAIFHTPFTFYTGSMFNKDNIQSANVCICLHRFAPLNCPAPLKKKKKKRHFLQQSCRAENGLQTLRRAHSWNLTPSSLTTAL